MIQLAPFTMNRPVAELKPLEPAPAKPTNPPAIISHVVWYPATPVRKSRLNSLLQSQQARLFHMAQQFVDSEIGLAILENATATIDQEHRIAVHGQDWQSLEQLQPWKELQRRSESDWLATLGSTESTGDEKLIAFQKLCRGGSPRSFPLATRYWNQRNLQSDIAKYAMRAGDSDTLARMVATTHSSDIKESLMSNLLQRGDANSVGLFLELTDRYQLFPLAQQCGHRSIRLPKRWLFKALRSNRMGMVRAASVTLSKVDDETITDYLVQLTSHPETAQAGVTALTARQDTSSTRIVQLASRDLRWSATVKTAQKKWGRLLAIN